MSLKLTDLSNRKQWEEKGYTLPSFDIDKMIKTSEKNCCWIHFGAGNIFRAFISARLQDLLDQGLWETGITVAASFDNKVVEEIFHKHNNRNLLVTLKGNGTIGKRVIASVSESFPIALNERFKEIFRNQSFQMASFTITEKGYNLTSPDVLQDIERGPAKCQTIMCIATSLALERYKAGRLPFAFVSMDNCSRNGELLKKSITEVAEKWIKAGQAPSAFLSYLTNPELVSFPWTMIDKITPRPDKDVKLMLEKDGFKDTELLVTRKNSWTAPYVNAEESEYLVIQDSFPNGRPPLEKSGIYFTDRETVNKAEKMKVGTCLNPLHTAMSIFGCLTGYKKISDEMDDEDIVSFIKEIGYKEGLPVSADPKIFSPRTFLDDVIQRRLKNPFLPDTPQRIAMDTSHKISVRFGQTVTSYMKNGMELSNLHFIPFFFALWLRYLTGLDDNDLPFEISPDNRLDTLLPYFKDLKKGDNKSVEQQITPVLKMNEIWGFDLYNSPLKDTVVQNLNFMLQGKGSIRKLLKIKLNNRGTEND